MTGLLLLFVVGIWFFITIKIVIFIAGKLPKMWWRPVVGIGLFVLIFPLPLLDEIVGGQQFEQLCKENSTMQVDRQKAIGKTVYKADLADIKINDKWIPITVQQWHFVDINTDKPILSYNVLFASGGRLMRMLGISEGGAPLIVRQGCRPEEHPSSVQAFEKFGINMVERPLDKNRKIK